MPACRRNVTLTARRSALSNQGQNLERERGHKARKLRSEGILGTHDLNSKSTIVAISSRVRSPRASARADSSPNGVLIDHSRKVRLTSTGRKTRYSWNCAYAYLCRHSWVADLDSQRTERVLAGSPDDARLRRPKSPVRSFSRIGLLCPSFAAIRQPQHPRHPWLARHRKFGCIIFESQSKQTTYWLRSFKMPIRCAARPCTTLHNSAHFRTSH